MAPELLTLIEKVENSTAVSQKLDALGDVLHFCTIHSIYDQGFKYIKIIQEILETYENRRDLFNILTASGNFFTKTGDYSKAIELHSESLQIALLNNDKTQECRSLYNLGIVYYYVGDYSKALENISNCITKNTDVKSELTYLYYNALGEVYRQMGNYELALSNLFKIIELLNGDETRNRIKGQCLQNIGSVYLSTKQYDKSLDYFMQALDLYQKEGMLEFEALALNNLGALYGSMGEYPVAIEHLAKALGIHQQIGGLNKDIIANTFCNLAEAYYKIDNYDLSIQCWLQALEIAGPIEAKHRLFEIHEGLYSVYKKLDEYSKALYHHELYMKFKEEVYTQEASDKLQKMTIIHLVETHKKEAEIEQIKNIEMSVTNQKLKELNDEKDGFLAIAAHDLKNPLTGILYIANSMKSGSCLPEEIIEFGEMLRYSAQAMFDLISNLLDSNKFESGGIELVFASIDSAQLIRHLVKNCKQNAKPKGIKINCITPEQAFVRADMQLLRQAIDNLLSNAVKYSPFNSEITVEVVDKQESETVEIRVRDNGPGLSAEDQKKLFGKFQRLSAKPTGGEHSSGLGLSICKKLVDMMKGTIRCESEFGKGATFIIELPSAEEEKYED